LISRDQDYCQVNSHWKGSGQERRKELKEIRKRKYGSQHKRKMLKMDGEGVNRLFQYLCDIFSDLVNI